MISLLISVCMFESRSSTLSIFVVISPVWLNFSVVLDSSVTKRSRSFSCSLRTLMMKSNASRASAFVGLFAMSLSSIV